MWERPLSASPDGAPVSWQNPELEVTFFIDLPGSWSEWGGLLWRSPVAERPFLRISCYAGTDSSAGLKWGQNGEKPGKLGAPGHHNFTAFLCMMVGIKFCKTHLERLSLNTSSPVQVITPSSWISSSPLLSFRPTEQKFPFLNISRLLVGLHSPRRYWYGFILWCLASGKTYLHHYRAARTCFVTISRNCTRRKSREEPHSAY